MKTSSKEMHDIAIYGAGGFGREAALMIRQINQVVPTWNVLGFFDDGKKAGEMVNGLPVLGGLVDLNKHDRPVAIAIAVADPALRKQIRNRIHNSNVKFPVLMHPSVLAGDEEYVAIGEGTIICAGTILTTNIQIGSFVIINLLCSIGHDVVIGDFSAVMPGCSLSGFDTIESEVFIGTGARILPHVTIKNRSKVGAGAVVLEGVPSGSTVVGVPARVVQP